jgi:hypothetical protein
MMTKLLVPACIVGLVAMVGLAAFAQQPEAKLPPGWTEQDMEACMLAGTPGKMHEELAKSVGVWHGQNTMWMAPGADPMSSECTVTVTSIMDGRYTKYDWEGEMPGMGLFHGVGIYGYDNVSKKFVSTWIDNHGTGIMNGVGERSPDGKTTTWQYTYNCPITQKPALLQEIETITGPDRKTYEMFGTDPKSGKEYKMMKVELTRKEGASGKVTRID